MKALSNWHMGRYTGRSSDAPRMGTWVGIEGPQDGYMGRYRGPPGWVAANNSDVPSFAIKF
jgi:hypothetical protein